MACTQKNFRGKKVNKSYFIQSVPAYLDSILLNFFTNAIKYSFPKRSPVIKLSSKSEDGFIALSINDNGIGIDLKEHSANLFGMYKTFHGNADARGIGLFITKNQVEGMGGKISVESVIGEGTTFKICLSPLKFLLLH